ncbi:transcriptional regulator [Actinorhabdospora filicis]|uniref:Transcriptional regulator n=1 Tax=Actinorhabdospora filicis TaxID=1785913 RepID=A0A9W6SJX7_9ACTN|nr:helix-turn-helix domain-containing protein [Actinorhabdospora filicis]GLZ78404.1 transcriptional regulator [Actinorhabdospora filicis]
MTDATHPEPAPEIRLDARAIRGVAHPLRVRILDLLRRGGPATATMLAERLGQSSGATSYHLRQLAAHGFVVEDPERGTARERWWRAAHRSTHLVSTDDVDLADAELYMRAVAERDALRTQAAIGELAAMSPEWRSAFSIRSHALMLTVDEALELGRELAAVFARYRRDDEGEAPEGARQVSAAMQILPQTGGRL